MSGPFFRTRDLTVEFGGLVALINLDLEIRKGEIVGLIGPNGAGKTTAFNAITNAVKPSKGQVFFRKKNITGRGVPKIARDGISRTFQNIRLYDDLTVVENVMVAGHSSVTYGIFEAVTGVGRFNRDERRIREKAEHLLELMGLIDSAEEKAESLSYGSQRKLEIARALALDPQLLLLDEPVAGMNPGETGELSALLRRLRSELDLTIGLIEHDMGFVMGLCDKIKVIDHGEPIAWGSPEQIRNNEKVIAAYLGEPQQGAI
jgi:branched-chain amino acid transport system ATP-binding protein